MQDRVLVLSSTTVNNCKMFSVNAEVSIHPRHRLSLRRQAIQETPTTYSSRRDLVARGVNAIEPIEVVDSEDEEIQASNEATSSTRCEDTSRPISCILNEFREAFKEEGHTKCVIFRSQPLQSAIRSLGRNINLKQKLFIKFSGEIGEDHGGPRREFFRLALSELHSSAYLEGPDGNKVFSHNLNLVEKRHYHIIGRLVALSIVQDGPGLHFMNTVLFKLMVGLDVEDLTGNETYVDEISGCIAELDKVSTLAEKDQFLVTYGDWLSDRGINAYRMTIDKKADIKHMIIKYYFFYRTSAEIAQFIAGMNEVGNLWELVKENHAPFEPLFCHQPKLLTKVDFDTLCEYSFSVEGSNCRVAEEETVYAWELFLEAIEERSSPATFSMLMAFLTGANTIPPCGFHKKITVHFYTQEVGVTRLPYVSTCSLEFWMPRGQTPERLSELMLTSLNESRGFLKV